MIFSFISLAIALIALILYFGERSKFLNKTDELTADIQKEMEEKSDIQSRYNALLNDIKKEEEFTKSKKVDEIQLLFTKVNMLDDKLTYFNTTFRNKFDEIISLLSGDESDFDGSKTKIENFIPEEEIKITNTQDNEENKEEIEDNNVIEENEVEIKEDNDKNEEIEENNEEIEMENEENENENVEEESDIENNNAENIDYEENADETITNDEEDEEEDEDEEEFLDDEEQNQSNDNEITTDVLNDIKDTLEDGDVLETTDKEEELTNYTDREFENFLNEKKNDINFDDLDAENMDTLADVVKSNNEEKDFNEDLKLNDIDEGFDIKSSIEKLRAQLEQEDKK